MVGFNHCLQNQHTVSELSSLAFTNDCPLICRMRTVVGNKQMKYDLDKLRSKVTALAATKTVRKDSEGYYHPFTDDNGSGSAVLRFLPPLDDEEFPFVQLYNHAFEVTSTKWFIDLCPTTLKQACPVCESNSALWNGPDKNRASLRKRKMYYISNVLVVRDPKQPEDEGNVFLYKYVSKIMGKLMDAITPPSPDADPIDPFDAEEGVNFRLRIVSKVGFPDYDKSSFDAPAPIGDAGLVESVLKQRRSLVAIIDPSQFNTYDEMKRKFDQIVAVAK